MKKSIIIIVVGAIAVGSVFAAVQATYIHQGTTVDYTPTSGDVSAGAVVVRGDLVGVANGAITSNTLGNLELGGVYDVAQKAEAITNGVPVYWDSDGNPVSGDSGTGAATATASGNTFMGFALTTTTAASETVRVALRSVDSSSAGYIIGTNNATRLTVLEATSVTNATVTAQTATINASETPQTATIAVTVSASAWVTNDTIVAGGTTQAVITATGWTGSFTGATNIAVTVAGVATNVATTLQRN